MEVILIAGKGRHGKDTTGNIIEEYLKEKGFKVARAQISRPLKEYARYYFGWDGREETKPRDLLQQLGTEKICKVTKPLKLKIVRKDFDNGFSEEQKHHRTEVELDNYDNFDYIIENTTLDKLKEDTIKIIKEHYNELLNS